MPVAPLPDRGVLSIGGEDAVTFLNGLITCAVEAGGPARYGALLTPQGKIVADFLLAPWAEGFLVDAPRAVAETLLKRLTLFRLRAKVTLADRSGELGVFAAWDGAAPATAGATAFADPRLAALGTRLIAPTDAPPPCDAMPSAYEAHRIGLAIPAGGRDFAYGDAFPHEAALDQLHGVDFDKGCYVGQEVVSRMQHRGTARTRVVALRFGGAAPAEGAEVTAGGRGLGRVGSVDAVAGRGIAILRLDRLGEALAAGHALDAGGVPIEARTPIWARYDVPAPAAETAR